MSCVMPLLLVGGMQAVYVPLQISLHDPSTPTSAAARFASVLRPVASMSKARLNWPLCLPLVSLHPNSHCPIALGRNL
jgi:hypothetical protein